jgi:2-iminobutanoate/2-iminopropanoate deaminase
VNTEINPSSIAQPAANYSHAVLTTSASRWLHTAGVVPIQADGTVAESLADQVLTVWENIGAILADVGMTAADVVSITTYVVVGEPLAPVMSARDAYMGSNRAASTLITVPALARPEWRIEVAVVAASAAAISEASAL